MTNKILVTGAAGFIGFHLSRYLVESGYEVIAIDNFNDYYNPQLKRQRASLLQDLNLPVKEMDICNADALAQLVEDRKPSHIVHLAAQAGVRYSLINPQAYVQANINGFLNILEACKNSPEIKLVYASSSSVYGLNTKVPFSINDRTDAQASFYGVTKKSNELMAATYSHLYGIRAIGLRFFTVYGPWGRPDMAYYQFTKSILEGTPIDIYNHGKMRRDFTYIDDIIQGVAAALSYEGKQTLFNLGNHQPEELGTMITLLEDYLGAKAIKRYLPMQPGDVVETYADISESQRELSFQPRTSLEVGLRLFTDWYINWV